MFEAFLLELAKVLQFSTLAPDRNGACLIVMREGNVPLLFELDEQVVPNKILLSSRILDFPLDRRAEIYEASLKMNEKIVETLSVKPDEDALYLHIRIAPDVREKEIDLILSRFLNQIKHSKEKIEHLLREPSKRPQIPPSPSAQVLPYKA